MNRWRNRFVLGPRCYECVHVFILYECICIDWRSVNYTFLDSGIHVRGRRTERPITAHAHVNKLVDDQLAKKKKWDFFSSSSVDKEKLKILFLVHIYTFISSICCKRSVPHVLHHLAHMKMRIKMLLFIHSIWVSIIKLRISSNAQWCIWLNGSFLLLYPIVYQNRRIDWQVLFSNYSISKQRKIDTKLTTAVYYCCSSSYSTAKLLMIRWHAVFDQGCVDTHFFNISRWRCNIFSFITFCAYKWWEWWWCSFVRWLSACLFPRVEI